MVGPVPRLTGPQRAEFSAEYRVQCCSAQMHYGARERRSPDAGGRPFLTPWGRSDRPLFGAMPSAGTYAQSDAKLTPVRDGGCG